MVARAARWCLPGRIPETVGQLALKRGLDHTARELREQPSGPGGPVELEAFQRVLQLVRRQQASETINDLLGRPSSLRLGVRVEILGLRAHQGPFPAARLAENRSSPYGLRSDPQPATTADWLPRPHTEHRTDPRGRRSDVPRAWRRLDDESG